MFYSVFIWSALQGFCLSFTHTQMAASNHAGSWPTIGIHFVLTKDPLTCGQEEVGFEPTTQWWEDQIYLLNHSCPYLSTFILFTYKSICDPVFISTSTQLQHIIFVFVLCWRVWKPTATDWFKHIYKLIRPKASSGVWPVQGLIWHNNPHLYYHLALLLIYYLERIPWDPTLMRKKLSSLLALTQ